MKFLIPFLCVQAVIFLVLNSCSTFSGNQNAAPGDAPQDILKSFIDPSGNFNPGPGWTLAWSDEFNGNAVDLNNWDFDVGAGSGGWGNNELEYYTARADNASVQNGNLVIRALRENYGGRQYTSARMKTRNKQVFRYGKIAARIQLPYGKGIWPALWMLGTNYDSVGWPGCGEIDVLEMTGGGTGDNTAYSAINYLSGGTTASQRGSAVNPDPLSRKYHYFEMDWNPNFVRFYLDTVLYWQYNISAGNPEMAPFQNSFFLLLNLAVGGTWPGYPDGSTVFPQTMLVDWVRYYTTDTSTPVIQITSPLDGSVLSGNFTVTGIANSPNPLNGVYLSVDGSSYAKTDGADTWKTNLSLSAGPHVIKAYCLDQSGKTSLTNLLNVTRTSSPVQFYFTAMPPMGSFDNLKGRVDFVNPFDYKVCVFIRVAGTWWVKPTFASPYSSLSFDGSWECDITTGGNDTNADRVSAYLLHNDYAGPSDMSAVISASVMSLNLDRAPDTTVPLCAITVPSGTVTTSQDHFVFSGTAQDNKQLQGVFASLNGSTFIRLAGTSTTNNSQIGWSTDLPLKYGTNTFQVFSKDLSGNVSSTNTASVVSFRFFPAFNPTDILPGISYAAIALNDYNNDGFPDIGVVGGAGGFGIFRNTGNAVFDQNIVLLSANGLSSIVPSIGWGDMNNDGNFELALSGVRNGGSYPKFYVYKNNGNGNFDPTPVEPQTGFGASWSSIAWGDYNHDGFPDIAIIGVDGSNSQMIFRVYRNNGDGTFNPTPVIPKPGWGLTACSMASGDFNNDGYADIAVIGTDGTRRCYVFKNNGDGTFDPNPIEPKPGWGVTYGSVTWVDYNKDGYADLCVAGSDGVDYKLYIFKNNGNGTFDPNPVEPIPNYGFSDASVAWGDLNGDGYPDLAVTGNSYERTAFPSIRNKTMVAMNNGNGTFNTNAITLEVHNYYFHFTSIQMADLDNDGRLDIVASGNDNNPVIRAYINR